MEERVELQRLILSLILGVHIHCQNILRGFLLSVDFFNSCFSRPKQTAEMSPSFIPQNKFHAAEAFLSNLTLHRTKTDLLREGWSVPCRGTAAPGQGWSDRW